MHCELDKVADSVLVFVLLIDFEELGDLLCTYEPLGM